MTMPRNRTYLALGDSMSIDDYTGLSGGGAVSQFYQALGEGWRLDDRTSDGCRMSGVPRDGRGDLITLTIGGNDLLGKRDLYLHAGLESFAADHLSLLRAIRRENPDAVVIVGDVYRPAYPLSEVESAALAAANDVIRDNVAAAGARLAPIHQTFRGHEATYLCHEIEPNLAGAKAIAGLFAIAYHAATSASLRAVDPTDRPVLP
jgi:lysophospholipase L1-like esterase